jgi:hypothetical protein
MLQCRADGHRERHREILIGRQHDDRISSISGSEVYL